VIVGVNKFISDIKNPIPLLKIDESIRQDQIIKLNKIKQTRNQANVDSCLMAVKQAAKGTDNLMPLVIEAVENYCTLGEISDTLRSVFGEYQA
jgi:methylmalonyl-CoA mutase N-terminal domain/subunit